MNVLDVQNLSIDLRLGTGRVQAVRDLSLSIGAGETVCLVGESGSGKTMAALGLLRMLPQIATWSADRLAIGGEDTTQLSQRAFSRLMGTRAAMIFQNPLSSLNPVFTIGDQLTEAYVCHRIGSRAEAKARALELLARVGIPDPESRLSQYPHQLSGGLRQRAMIALALMCRPQLLIADEPTTALDVTVQAQTLRLLRELVRETGVGLLLITHDLGVVSRMADRVVVMYAGREVEHGPCATIFAEPLHPYTRGLIDCVPAGEPGARFRQIPGEVPPLRLAPTGCDFRARCPSAGSLCTGPIPLQIENGHRWRCVMGADEALQAPSPASEAVQ